MKRGPAPTELRGRIPAGGRRRADGWAKPARTRNPTGRTRVFPPGGRAGEGAAYNSSSARSADTDSMRAIPRTAPAPGEQPLQPDPREHEEWFQRLDPGAQDVVRERWVQEEVEWETVGILVKNERRDVTFQGVLVFAVAELALSFATDFHLVSFLPALLLGAGVGFLWYKANAGMLLSPVCAMPVYFVLQYLLGPTVAGHAIDMVWGPLLVGFPAAYLGLQRDLGTAGWHSRR